MAALLTAIALAFPQGTATIATPHGRISVRVEIAETTAAWERGLMYRRRLAARRGMIFVFPSDTRAGFWMKNTLIPLSTAFYDSNGRIRRILDMTPCRRDPCRVYDPGVDYRGALEVNRGAFRRWGVRAGNTITLRRRP
jgi:uncharacterized protein